MSEKKKPRKPYGKSQASRIRDLENSIEEIKDLLEPSEMKVVFWSPHTGTPEPNRDEYPKGTIFVRCESPYEIQDPDPEMEKKLDDNRKREMARSAEVRQIMANHMMKYKPSAPPRGGTDSQPGDKVIAEGFGWRWGVQPAIQHRFKDSKDINRGMQMLSRKGII